MEGEKGLAEGASRGRARTLAVIITALVVLYLLVDVPLARALQPLREHQPRWIDAIYDGAAQYGQGYSLVFVVALIAVMQPERRRDAAKLVIGVLAAAAVVHISKMTTGRARPEEYLGGAPMWNFLKGFHDSKFASFPSAHAVGAFALAGALSAMYPRGKPVFVVAAVLCGLTRIFDIQHYTSDVLASAVVGMWTGGGVYRWQWSERLAARIVPARADRV